MGTQNTISANGVFEGGGVKGIGLIGALAVAEEKGYKFENVAGNSAGAIVASLVAAGYSAAEIKDFMYGFDFKKVLKPSKLSYIPFIGILLQLKLKMGMYKAKYLKKTLEKYLKKKGVETFGDLKNPEGSPYPYKLQLIASDISKGKMVVLPNDLEKYGKDPDKFSVAKAVRMSMSIPVLFTPVKLGKSIMVDGVLVSNYPVWIFDRTVKSKTPTIGFKIMSLGDYKPKELDSSLKVLEASVLTAMEAHDQRYIETHNFKRTIHIDTKGTGIAEFWLKKEEKDTLYNNGRKAAEEFFSTWDCDEYLKEHKEDLKC
jgi:NTE family protein